MGNILRILKTLNHNEEFLPYVPEKDSEVDRFQIIHHLTREIWNENYFSPMREALEHGIKVLDIGCGSGTWVCDMASDYRRSEITGIDKISIFPTEKPFNVKFQTGNILDGLDFPDESFHFIHIRFMAIWFTRGQYERIVIPELLRLLVPGGWLELVEPEIVVNNPGKLMDKYVKLMHTKLTETDRDPFFFATGIDDFLHSTGQLEHINHDKKSIPLGNWNQQYGALCLQTILPSIVGVLVTVSEISEKQVEKITKELTVEANANYSYIYHHRIFAQKIQELSEDDRAAGDNLSSSPSS
ncbi:14241_t:CDS:2 [Ambispora leptoticha]|uniref:14241_t:CDS:1 n=1 Tax=Ambispora leptoticha TaxID=144679 RepID=A0A9N9FR31_9GLOM|nr:14241_t:CDS:2 [Ambispora leptoticha]